MLSLSVQAMDDRPFEAQFAELTENIRTGRLGTITMSHWLEAANDLVLKSQKLSQDELFQQLSQPLRPKLKQPSRLTLKNEGTSISVLAPFAIIGPPDTVRAYIESLRLLKECMACPQQLQIAIDQLPPEEHGIRNYILKQQELLTEAKDLAL